MHCLDLYLILCKKFKMNRRKVDWDGGGGLNSDCKFMTMILLVNKACKILADLTFCVSELALV